MQRRKRSRGRYVAAEDEGVRRETSDIAKRRRLHDVDAQDSADGMDDSTTSFSSASQEGASSSIPFLPTLDDRVRELAVGLCSQDAETALRHAKMIRILLSGSDEAPANAILNGGVLRLLVEALRSSANTALRIEAAWALTNVAATKSEHTKAVVDAGAVPVLVAALQDASPELRHQALWCIGNVARDSKAQRDLTLSAGALPPLLLNLATPASLPLLRTAVWALAAICRGPPPPPPLAVRPALPLLAAVVVTAAAASDAQLLRDCLSALGSMAAPGGEAVTAMVAARVPPLLVTLMPHADADVTTSAARALCALLSSAGSGGGGGGKGGGGVSASVVAQTLLDAGVLPRALMLLAHPARNVRSCGARLVSEIAAAGSSDQIARVCAQPDLPAALVAALAHDHWPVRVEALWALHNVAVGGGDGAADQLCELKVIPPAQDMLGAHDADVLPLALTLLDCCLSTPAAAAQRKRRLKDFLAIGGAESVLSLCDHANDDVAQEAAEFAATHLEGGNGGGARAEGEGGGGGGTAGSIGSSSYGSSVRSFASDNEEEDNNEERVVKERGDGRSLKEAAAVDLLLQAGERERAAEAMAAAAAVAAAGGSGGGAAVFKGFPNGSGTF